MHKIPTLFRRDPENMSRVLNEVNPAAQWVADGEGYATRKFDGTCLLNASVSGWWARREVKPGKLEPAGYVAVETDPNTNKTVGWEPIEQSSFVKAWREAMEHDAPVAQGTYELCGPKVNGNPEGFDRHTLIPHGYVHLSGVPRDFEGLAELMADFQFEGVVWHHSDNDDRMVKIKRRDFGYK